VIFWLVILAMLALYVHLAIHHVRLEREMARLMKEWEDAL